VAAWSFAIFAAQRHGSAIRPVTEREVRTSLHGRAGRAARNIRRLVRTAYKGKVGPACASRSELSTERSLQPAASAGRAARTLQARSSQHSGGHPRLAAAYNTRGSGSIGRRVVVSLLLYQAELTQSRSCSPQVACRARACEYESSPACRDWTASQAHAVRGHNPAPLAGYPPLSHNTAVLPIIRALPAAPAVAAA
jgi:hypothetical protein